MNNIINDHPINNTHSEIQRLHININNLINNFHNVSSSYIIHVNHLLRTLNANLESSNPFCADSNNFPLSFLSINNQLNPERTHNFFSHTSQLSTNSTQLQSTQNGIEVVTSITTTSPADLPESLFDVVRNLMHDNFTQPTTQFTHNQNLTPVIVPLSPNYIREIPSKKYKIKHSIEQDDIPICAICYDDFIENERYRKLPCSHEFHKRCIDQWFKESVKCPLCTQDVRTLIDNT